MLYLTIFWLIGILGYCIYRWYWATSKNEINNKVTPKVNFDFNSDKRHSTSSIESLECSDNECTRRKNMKTLKYEIKTRWPSQTSIRVKSYKLS